MHTALSYRTNRDLFSNYYLDERLPETEAWDELSDDELREKQAEIVDLWEREQDTVTERTESSLEESFVRPLFRKLDIPFEVEETVQRGQRRPDYGFFPSEDAARGAFSRKTDGGDFYRDAVAVADAKRWGRPLDTRGSGEHKRDFENPSYQIHVYLRETPVRWAVLTDGRKWRLYYGPTSHRLDSYYEIDLPTVLERGDLEEFKYFYLFFRHGAFLEGSSGECFLDEVYDESNVFAQELGEDLQDNIHEAIKILSEGFMQHPDNDLSEDDIDLVHDSSLIYLYRLIFVLYAESEGRDLLDTNNEIYEESYSLNTLKRDVAGELDSPSPKYRDWQDNLWDRLDELFKLIDRGSKSRGIPEEDLYIPAYNGGLFRTNPDEDDSVEARFIANHQVGDAYLAEVIELLTRSQNGNGGGKIFVDYSSLDVRHLGSIYEGLLEYQLDVADEPLALEDGEYVPAGEGDEVIVEEGEVHLSTGSGERKATGSYYTPEYVVEYIVEETLGPLVDDIRGSLVGQSAFDEGGFAEEFAEGVFDLKILDPAMGSGHFLTSAIDYLAREIIDAQERQAAQQGIETVDEEHDINWARRQVAQRCIYGVDLNPLAVELAKVSLWLRTLAAEQPLAFLDHHLKTGNSLVGSDIEKIEQLESDAGGDGQNASLADFGVARKGTIEQLMWIYQDFIAIENQDLADVKEMEAKYDEFERNKLRQRLEGMTNVHTAEKFGLDNLPSDAYKRMATALEDDSEWERIEQSQWFQDAQNWAADDQYFHWKLEYPEVFYNTSGDEKGDSGFDAVIGNPPYIRSRNLPDAHKNFYKKEYRSAEGAYDIYIPFLEQAAALGAQNSFIIPNKWTTTNYGETIRDLLIDEYSLSELVDVSHLDVFPDADIYPLLVSYSSDGESGLEGPTIRHVKDPSNISNTDGVTVSSSIIDQLGGRVIPVNLTPELAPIIEKALAQDTRLGEHIQMTEAIHTGNVRDKLVVEEEVDDSCEKLADGKSIDRHQVDWSGQYIRYNEGLIDGDKGEYGDLRERKLFDRDEKLFIRDISYRPVAAYDDNQLFALNTLYSVTQLESSNCSLKFLLAIFNSEFVNRYFRQVYGGTHVSGDYLRFKPMFSYNIPVPNPNQDELLDDYVQEIGLLDEDIDTRSIAVTIEDLTDVIRNAKDIKTSLNLTIVDFLDDCSEGQQLADISGYQPPKGVSDSPLSETASTLENLRVGSVDVSEEGNTVTILISARYKPEDPDEFETDRWDYTETELMPAMEFIGLSDEQRLLIREFVPYATEEAGGFAGFRETATKTNSLLDRLEELTLPAISDVTSELNRYQNQIQKAERLDKKVETADELLDNIIYDLYGLSSDEKALVEKHRE